MKTTTDRKVYARDEWGTPTLWYDRDDGTLNDHGDTAEVADEEDADKLAAKIMRVWESDGTGEGVELTAKAAEIRAAVEAAGPGAYLYVHDSGDVILWASEADSDGDDGSRALARWQVDAETMRQLEEV